MPVVRYAPKPEAKELPVATPVDTGKEALALLDKQHESFMHNQMAMNNAFIVALQELVGAKKRVKLHHIERDAKGRITNLVMDVETL